MTHSLLYTIDPFTEMGCTAPGYAFVNYLNRQFTPKFYVGFRSDMLNEKKGQRTGIPGSSENTLYATKYFGSTVLLRPELGLTIRGMLADTTMEKLETSSSSV